MFFLTKEAAVPIYKNRLPLSLLRTSSVIFPTVPALAQKMTSINAKIVYSRCDVTMCCAIHRDAKVSTDLRNG